MRRAQEIYYRRNHKNVSISKNDYIKPKTYLGSKIVLEMLILVIMAVTVFAIKNKDYIFTQDFLNGVAQYNINLTEKFGFIKNFLKNDEEDNEVFVNSENTVENKTENVVTENVTTENNATQNQPVIQESQQQGVVTDVNLLKNSYNFIKPIEGIISSGFGARESKYQNVTGTHTGIDIAAEERNKN